MNEITVIVARHPERGYEIFEKIGVFTKGERLDTLDMLYILSHTHDGNFVCITKHAKYYVTRSSEAMPTCEGNERGHFKFTFKFEEVKRTLLEKVACFFQKGYKLI